MKEMKEEEIMFGGKINRKEGVTEFPAVIDAKGKIAVPNFIRQAMEIKAGTRVQCTIKITGTID